MFRRMGVTQENGFMGNISMYLVFLSYVHIHDFVLLCNTKQKESNLACLSVGGEFPSSFHSPPACCYNKTTVKLQKPTALSFSNIHSVSRSEGQTKAFDSMFRVLQREQGRYRKNHYNKLTVGMCSGYSCVVQLSIIFAHWGSRYMSLNEITLELTTIGKLDKNTFRQSDTMKPSKEPKEQRGGQYKINLLYPDKLSLSVQLAQPSFKQAIATMDIQFNMNQRKTPQGTVNPYVYFCVQSILTSLSPCLFQVDYAVIASQAGATLNNLLSHAQELVAKLRSLQLDQREFVCLKFLVLFSLGESLKALYGKVMRGRFSRRVLHTCSCPPPPTPEKAQLVKYKGIRIKVMQGKERSREDGRKGKRKYDRGKRDGMEEREGNGTRGSGRAGRGQEWKKKVGEK